MQSLPQRNQRKIPCQVLNAVDVFVDVNLDVEVNVDVYVNVVNAPRNYLNVHTHESFCNLCHNVISKKFLARFLMLLMLILMLMLMLSILPLTGKHSFYHNQK